jgi:hypothetical protein
VSPESVQPDIAPRTWRALSESMAVLPEGGDIYTVIGENGNGEYQVDAREGRCTCPDHRHREVTCKHARRVAYATGDSTIPDEIPRESIDELLGSHTDEPVRVVVSDGRQVVEEPEERPDDCDCGEWNEGLDLPCWPCYRDGFETPASEVTDDA